jgi:hypothetical protein
MEQSGACQALKAITDATVQANQASGQTCDSSALQRQGLLSDMFDQINGQGNAISLDTTVNNAVSELMP